MGGGEEQKGPPPLPKICHRYPTMMKLGTVILILLTFLESLNIIFNKPGYNFDDVSKNTYPKAS